MNLQEIFSYELICKGSEKIIYKPLDEDEYVYKLISNQHATVNELIRREQYLIEILNDMYSSKIIGICSDENNSDKKFVVIKQKYVKNKVIDNFKNKVVNAMLSRNIILINNYFDLCKNIYRKFNRSDSIINDALKDLQQKHSFNYDRLCFFDNKNAAVISDICQNNLTLYDNNIFLYDCSVNFLY